MSHEKISSLISDSRIERDDEPNRNHTSPPLYYKEDNENDKSSYNQSNGDNEDLGPLPPKWEKAMTENGEVYFIE